VSHIEYEIVAALAFVCTVLFVLGAGVDWRQARAKEIMGFLLVYGIAFWVVLIGWFLVRTLILAVRSVGMSTAF